MNTIVISSLFFVVVIHTALALTLKDNGYKDLVVAISKNLDEDPNLIDNIKKGFTLASGYLYEATRHRAYFDTITIVVPETWSSKSEYLISSKDSFGNAHVQVVEGAETFAPRVTKVVKCGQQAEGQMFLTPIFLDGRSYYGEPRRTIVHEFGHFRYGLLDEYAYSGKTPEAYLAEDGKTVVATGCSKAYSESIPVYKSSKGDRKCTASDDYAKCYPAKNEGTKGTASIMHNQHKKEIISFCDSGENPDTQHNFVAPNYQNRWCKESSWYFMSRHEDFVDGNNLPGSAFRSTTPTFKIVQARLGQVVLTLDVSTSMGWNNKLDQLRQAARAFIQTVPYGTPVSIVKFSGDAQVVVRKKTVSTPADRAFIISNLPTTAIGGTGIGRGLVSSLDIITGVKGSHVPSAGTIVLITDGEETKSLDPVVSDVIPRIRNTGVTISSIGIGQDASQLLEPLSQSTSGAFYFSPVNSASSQASSTLREALLTIIRGLPSSSQSKEPTLIQIYSSSVALAAGGDRSTDGFTIDSDAGVNTTIAFDWLDSSQDLPQIHLTSPSRLLYQFNDLTYDRNFRTAELLSPASDEIGDWQYTIVNPAFSFQRQFFAVSVSTRSTVDDPIVLTAKTAQPNSTYPNPVVILADLTKGERKVTRASVVATVSLPSDRVIVIDLIDNGNFPDLFEDDGTYTGTFTSFDGDGKYSVQVRASAAASQAQAVVFTPPVQIDSSATVDQVPLQQPTSLGKFLRTTSAGAFELQGYTDEDLLPPIDISDLEAMPSSLNNEFAVTLQWTAPGDDGPNGKANSYDIVYAGKFEDVRKFTSSVTHIQADDVIDGSLDPLPGGSAESVTIRVKPIAQNNDLYYFGIKSTDDANLTSTISNVVQLKQPASSSAAMIKVNEAPLLLGLLLLGLLFR